MGERSIDFLIPIIISLIGFVIYVFRPLKESEGDPEKENLAINRIFLVVFLVAGGFALVSRAFGTDLGETLQIMVAFISRLF